MKTSMFCLVLFFCASAAAHDRPLDGQVLLQY